jgi:hypothetical protein
VNVDDSDLWVGSWGGTHELVHEMQQQAQAWEKALHASGGALALDKCFWIGLFWKFENELPQAAKIEETPWEIHLTSGYSTERQLIQWYEANEGCRTLGAWLAGTGDKQTHRLLNL